MSGSSESREKLDAVCKSIRSIPAEARGLFRDLVEEELIDPEQLRTETIAYAEKFERLSGQNEFIDPQEAARIRDICVALLNSISSDTPEIHRRLIQAGVRYFVIEDDGDNDQRIGGLDDDLAVANAVARHIGRADLVIE